MSRGRPKLPEGQQLVHVSLRLPRDVVDRYGAQGNRSAEMRQVLENHLKEQETTNERSDAGR